MAKKIVFNQYLLLQFISQNKRPLAVAFFIGILLSTFTGQALAWGDAGHQTICQIAFKQLNSDTRLQVATLIQQDSGYHTFAESCTWPDTIRRKDAYKRYKKLHFINGEPGATTMPTECPAGCVTSAISEEAKALANTALPVTRRIDALKFLGHFVGDIHQPLHAGYRHDLGGNKTSVLFYGQPYRLHRVWDSLLIGQRTDNWQKLAAQLNSNIKPIDRTLWRGSSPLTWANESFQIVEHSVYDFNEHEDLSKAYYRNNIHTIEARLMAAGVRLAELLERALH